MTQPQSTNARKYQNQNALLQLSLSRFIQALLDLIPNVETVLDAGCGEGYIIRQIKDKYPHMPVRGVDLSYDALQTARRLAPGTQLAEANVTALPLRDKSVDLVVSSEVLEHLVDPARAVAEYKRVSRRYLLLSVPNEPVFRLMRLARGLNVPQWGDHPEHVQHWNMLTFSHFLEAQGLRILNRTSPLPFCWSIVLCHL